MPIITSPMFPVNIQFALSDGEWKLLKTIRKINTKFGKITVLPIKTK